jgi:hypothetical protein
LREIGDFIFLNKKNCHYCKIWKWKEKTPGQWYPGCPRIYFLKKLHKQQFKKKRGIYTNFILLLLLLLLLFITIIDGTSKWYIFQQIFFALDDERSVLTPTW